MPKIMKITLNLLKLHIKYCRLFFFPDTVYITISVKTGQQPVIITSSINFVWISPRAGNGPQVTDLPGQRVGS